jgi:hypothetical protein
VRIAAALWMAFVAGAATVGCGASTPPRAAAKVTTEPHWQDVFDSLPELFVVARPQLLRQDKVYGPLLRRTLVVAHDRSKIVASTHLLEAMEDAEQIVVGVRPDPPDRPGERGELVVVVRGVRADIDPGKLADDDGKLPWQPGPSAKTRELTCEQDDHGHPVGASLLELPGRTWVIATGAARNRARDAFAHPFGRPEMDLDATALAIVRIDGPSLVSHVHALRDLGSLGAVGRRLSYVMFALPPGGDGTVRATLSYADEDAAAFAEVTVREAVGAMARSQRPGFAWLASAKVDRPDKRVVLTAPHPPQLVDGLLKAGSLPLDANTPAPN